MPVRIASNPKKQKQKTVQSKLMTKLKMKKLALINETKQVEKVMMLVAQNQLFYKLKKGKVRKQT
jgi:hypothetical protein